MQALRPTSAGARWRDQRGITLVELLVAMFMGILLMGVVTMMLVSSLKAQPRIADRNAAIQQGRVLQERLTRELRLAYGVDAASASSITFQTFLARTSCGGGGGDGIPLIQCEVTYSCSADACTRAEGPPGGAAVSSAVLVDGISNTDSVFTYEPVSSPANDIQFVGVKLEYPSDEPDEDAVTLEDGAALRNR